MMRKDLYYGTEKNELESEGADGWTENDCRGAFVEVRFVLTYILACQETPSEHSMTFALTPIGCIRLVDIALKCFTASLDKAKSLLSIMQWLVLSWSWFPQP